MSDKGTLDDLYLEWLYRQIASVRNRNPHRSYWQLARMMYRTPFRWRIQNDRNRAEDGLELRHQFLHEEQLTLEEVDHDWMELRCSFLEMLLALSKRVAYESYGSFVDWFWQLVENMELIQFTDAEWSFHAEHVVDEHIRKVCERRYGREGAGGLFPLRYARSDQRRLELWSQLSAYVLENEAGVANGPRH